MVIANACNHPDCANTAEMLKQAMGDLEIANLRLKAAQDALKMGELALKASRERADDWRGMANSRAAELIRQADEISRLNDELARFKSIRSEAVTAQAENERLRAALANSKDPCIYCSLPADEFAKCKLGFPGCSRADDMAGCPELGARLENDQLRAELDTLRTELAKGGMD